MPGDVKAKVVQETSIRATVIRADGTREELGEISYYHRNPIKRWLRKWKRMLRRPTEQLR